MDAETRRKWLPDILLKDELPEWFITKAEERSRGTVEFIVVENKGDRTVIWADFFLNNEYIETKKFELKAKPGALYNGRKETEDKGNL